MYQISVEIYSLKYFAPLPCRGWVQVVHGDLKPANFVFVRGSLKLMDFGIAKAISSETTNISRDSRVCGSLVWFGLGCGIVPVRFRFVSVWIRFTSVWFRFG